MVTPRRSYGDTKKNFLARKWKAICYLHIIFVLLQFHNHSETDYSSPSANMIMTFFEIMLWELVNKIFSVSKNLL